MIYAIASGLKANLDAIDGISVSRIPRMNPTPPIIHMWPSEIPAYHRAMSMGMSGSGVHGAAGVGLHRRREGVSGV